MTREKKRRTYGSGGLTQRADGIWVGTIEAGWSDTGKRRRVTVSSKDHDTAARKLRDKRHQLDRAGQAQVNVRATVKAITDQWLPIQSTRLRPKSYATTASAVRLWIVPTIGHRRMDALSPGDVRAVEAAQRKAGKSTSTMLRTHSTLMSLLQWALIEGYPIAPGVLKVERPAVAVNDRAALDIDQCIAVLAAAKELPDGSRWAAALLQGMRQAEALGLTWDEVDLERATLTISWQLQPLPYNIPRDRASGFRVPDGYEVRQLDGSLHLVRPKSKKGWRVIPLVPWMRDALAYWREVGGVNPHGLVWPRTDGRPQRARNDDAAWYALQDSAGVIHPTRLNDDGEPDHYTIHEARHATATILLELGVDPSIAAGLIGQAKVIEAYRHVNTTMKRKALEQVAERLALG